MLRGNQSLQRLGAIITLCGALAGVGTAPATAAPREAPPTSAATIHGEPVGAPVTPAQAPRAPEDEAPGGPNPRGPAPADSTTLTTDGGEFIPVGPARLLDTRPGQVTVDGQAAGGGALGPATTFDLPVAGRGGVPALGAGSVVLTVTGTEPTNGTYVTAWPTGADRPTASNVNLVPGQTAPNAVVVKLGADGKVSLYNNAGRTNLVVDVAGWFPESSTLVPGVPRRLLETRPGATTFDGRENGGGALAPGATRDVQIDGRAFAAAPAGAAAVLNVTATNPTAATYVTAWAAGSPRPLASNLNVVPGQTSPNAVLVPIGANGRISLYNNAGSTDLVVDLLAVVPAGTGIRPLDPARLLDTRPGARTVDGDQAGTGAFGPREARALPVLGRAGVPTEGVAAVVVNLTGVAPTEGTYLTGWPAGSRPTASNLNLAPGEVRAAFAVVGVGPDGTIQLYNNAGRTDLAVDVLGYIATGTSEPSTVVIPAGTAVLGTSDVSGVTQDGNLTRITLAPGTPPPSVGQRLVLEPNVATPEIPGAAGVVTAAAGPVVTVEQRPLDEVFDAVDLHYDSAPATPPAEPTEPADAASREGKPSPRRSAPDTARAAPRAASPDPLAYRTRISSSGLRCAAGTASADTGVDLSLENTYAKADYQWSRRGLFPRPYVRTEVGGDLVVTTTLGAQARQSCSATPLTILRPVAIGPTVVLFKFVITIDLALSAQGSLTATDTFHVTRGVYSTSSLGLVGTGAASHTRTTGLAGSVNAEVKENNALSALLYGVAGLRIDAGPTLTGTYDATGTTREGQPGCMTLQGSFAANLNLTLDVWARSFDAGVLEYTAGPFTLATNCLSSGTIQVTLVWDNADDQDLHVIEPDGSEIFYSAPGPTRTGGRLDQDDNVGACGSGATSGVENIFWPDDATPDRGTYTVRVVPYRSCGTPANWRAEVRLGDRLVQTETGQSGGEFTFTY